MGLTNFNAHIFPASEELRKRIPLWLKFYCYTYSKNSLTRASIGAFGPNPASAIVGSPLIRVIQLPAPREYTGKTDVAYNTSLDPEQTATEADPTDGIMAIGSFFAGIDDAVLNFFGMDISVNMDMTDTTYQGVNKRQFNFKIIMPAKTEEDSRAAADICDAFEALALPTARLSTIEKLVDHPPMWTFGIGSLDDLQNDQTWTGQPQLCLLDQVVVNKSGFQDSYAIASGGKLKPLTQTLNLTFVELEPAMRSSLPFSSTIVNRSTAFYTFGGAAIQALNAGQAVGRAVGLG